MIASIRLFRSDPVTPDTHASGDDKYNLANHEDALGINIRSAAEAHYLFIACPLPLVDEPRADPPCQRMEPEDGLHSHVDGRGQVVLAADMAELVRKNRIQLGLVEPLRNAFRQQQDRPQNSADAWFDEIGRRHQGDGNLHASRNANDARSAPQGVNAPPPK
jgi:hypothetical protein